MPVTAVYIYYVTQGMFMNSAESQSKETCTINAMFNRECPVQCAGRLAMQWVDSSNSHPEGIYVEVCTNPQTLNNTPGTIDFCGNAPNLITFYQKTPATQQQINTVMYNWGWE